MSNAVGTLTSETQIHADKTKDVFQSNITGRSYVAEHQTYDSNGKLVSIDQMSVDGSHIQTAYQTGVTMVSTSGAADVFRSFGGETFEFAKGFGRDTITGFHAGLNGVQDVLSLDTAQVSNFAELQKHLLPLGADTLLILSTSDTILLKGVTVSSLTSDDFAFKDYGLLHV